MLREHSDYNVNYYVNLRTVRSGAVDKDVSSFQRNFRMIRVDNRRHRAHGSFGVVYDWINRRILDDVQVPAKMPIVLRNPQLRQESSHTDNPTS